MLDSDSSRFFGVSALPSPPSASVEMPLLPAPVARLRAAGRALPLAFPLPLPLRAGVPAPVAVLAGVPELVDPALEPVRVPVAEDLSILTKRISRVSKSLSRLY